MSMIDYNEENYYFGGVQEAPIGDPSIFPLSQEDIDKIVEENGGSGTGGNIDPEQKEVTYTENGVNIIEPSGDFDGLSSVKVTVDVPGKTIKEDTVELSATENGTVETSASEFGVDGLKAVSVSVNVPQKTVKDDAVELSTTENGTVEVSAADYNVDGLKTVNVAVNVPIPSIKQDAVSLNVTENGEYSATASEYSVDGLKTVNVSVGVPQKTVKDEAVTASTTENGTVEVLAADYDVDGLKEVSVTVNVPSPSIKPEPVSLTFNENRTYTISAEEYNVDGLSSVDIVVDVPSAPSVTKFYYSNGFMSESDDTIITDESYSSGSSLVSVVIGSNVTKIADYAFKDWISLSSVTLGGVESIGMGAFAGCHDLLYLTIPSSVHTIGNEAFTTAGGGGNNIDITFESTIPVSLESGDTVLDLFGVTGSYVTIPTIHVPEGFEEEYATHDAGWELIAQYITGSDLPLTTFYYNDGTSSSVRTLKLTSDSYSDNYLNGVEIGEGVKIIGDNAFGDTDLSSVTIPSSVVSIGTVALAIDDCMITFTTETPNVPLEDKYGNVIEAFGGSSSTSEPADVTIIVPSGCKANYVGSDKGWEYYANYIHEA